MEYIQHIRILCFICVALYAGALTTSVGSKGSWLKTLPLKWHEVNVRTPGIEEPGAVGR